MLHALVFFLSFFASVDILSDNSKVVDHGNPVKELVQTARSLLGNPYKYSGCKPGGFDCSGFTSYVYKSALDLELLRSSSAQATLGKEVKRRKAKPGDLIFFKKKGRIFHVAMIIENHKDKLLVIHSTSSRGVIIEDIDQSEYWSSKKYFIKRVI